MKKKTLVNAIAIAVVLIVVVLCGMFGKATYSVDCEACGGSGEVFAYSCVACGDEVSEECETCKGAGGLEPSTYHNKANTVAPVITISSSGANAGFVNLWGIPVWSSDSSYIDSTMTPYVYFWYAFLKRYQNNIYNIQTGSAQPHIYPNHIASLPMGDLDAKKIEEYTQRVTPMFLTIAQNYRENRQLASLRDWLLPMLMNGQATVRD